MKGVPFLFVVVLFSSFAFSFEISELRDFDTGKFSDYPEIGGVKQNVMLAYYSSGKGGLPSWFSDFAQTSLEFMRKFEKAYSLSSSKNSGDLIGLPDAINLASESVIRMEELASDSIPLSKHSVYLARSALERYVSDQAGRLKSLGDSETQTRKKLAYYWAAAKVFEYSGVKVKAAEIRAEYESIFAAYKLEIGFADHTFEESKELCRQSIKNSGDWFGVVPYSNLRKCTDGLLAARMVYVSHLEYEKIKEVDAELVSTEEAKDLILRNVAIFFLFSVVLFLALNALVFSRLKAWYNDGYDVSLGSEILRWKKMRNWLIIALLLFSLGLVSGEILVGNFRTEPRVVLISTNNLTLFWETSQPATSFINCTGPGFGVLTTPVETEPTSIHSFYINTSFRSEGIFSCTITSFPVNETITFSEFNTSVNCEGVRLQLQEPSIRTAVYFTRPRGSGPYYVNLTMQLKNSCVGRGDVSVRTMAPADMEIKTNQLTIHALEKMNVPITLTVGDSVAEGDYSGSIVFSAAGSSTAGTVNISVHWPGPKLLSEAKAIGNVISGTNVTGHVLIKEIFGYREANGVHCSVSFQDAKQTPQTYGLGRIAPFGNAICSFSIAIPMEKVDIGNYTVWVRFNSTNAGEHTVETNYTIPAPYMILAPKSLDLGKITFEVGKETSNSVLTVMENGGFTPIEGMKFELLEGEEGWISLPECNQVPPGGKTKCIFKVSLGENASIGTKEWTIGVKSRYTPEIAFTAKVDVYFIGIDDSIAALQEASNYSIMSKFGQAETLKSNTIIMLNELKSEGPSMSDMAIVISINDGVWSLLGQMEMAYIYSKKGDGLSVARSLLGTRMALERITSSYRTAKLNRTALISALGNVYSASADFWKASSEELLEKLEAEALANENLNYLRASEYYYFLGMIYKPGDAEKSAAFAKKADEMQKYYEQSVKKAGDIKRNAKRLAELARAGTVAVVSKRLILNPFSYKESVGYYELALADYKTASELYKIAGQQNELVMILPKIEELEKEYRFADRAFVIGVISMVVISAIAVMRIIIGMQQYREDEDDSELGGVMVR